MVWACRLGLAAKVAWPRRDAGVQDACTDAVTAPRAGMVAQRLVARRWPKHRSVFIPSTTVARGRHWARSRRWGLIDGMR
jgi:hypothetical protein